VKSSAVPGPPGPSSSLAEAADLIGIAPPKLRRRPLLIALGVILVVVGAITSWYVVTIVKDTASVVAALTYIPRGGLIERSALTVIEIRPDPLLRTLPASELESLVGQRASVDIPAGVIVAPEAVSAELLPAAGQAIVGVSLAAIQRPATPPRLRQPITLVALAAADAETQAKQPQYQAVVVAVTTSSSDGQSVVIDVSVPKDQAADIARLAAGDQLAAYWDAE
jgi:hypothetical protein